MEIELINVPRVAVWDGSMVFDLMVSSQLITRESFKLSEVRIEEETSKVHALIHDAPKNIDNLGRMKLAAAVLRFLGYHGLGEGADVCFVGFTGEKLYSSSDFPAQK